MDTENGYFVTLYSLFGVRIGESYYGRDNDEHAGIHRAIASVLLDYHLSWHTAISVLLFIQEDGQVVGEKPFIFDFKTLRDTYRDEAERRAKEQEAIEA